MELTATYIWSQILTVIEYGTLGLSYLAKKRKLVVILDIFSMTAGIIAFLLLGADLGMGMSIIILIANFYYLYEEHAYPGKKKLYVHDFVALGLVLFAIAIITVATYDGWLSLLSVAATVLYEISIWQKSTKVYKFLGIPVALCWMTYNGFIGSIFGVICELIMFGTSTYGYARDLRRERKIRAANKKRLATLQQKKRLAASGQKKRLASKLAKSPKSKAKR